MRQQALSLSPRRARAGSARPWCSVACIGCGPSWSPRSNTLPGPTTISCGRWFTRVCARTSRHPRFAGRCRTDHPDPSLSDRMVSNCRRGPPRAVTIAKKRGRLTDIKVDATVNRIMENRQKLVGFRALRRTSAPDDLIIKRSPQSSSSSGRRGIASTSWIELTTGQAGRITELPASASGQNRRCQVREPKRFSSKRRSGEELSPV
jgi:hypothetical protein